jgi:hypothetical protein
VEHSSTKQVRSAAAHLQRVEERLLPHPAPLQPALQVTNRRSDTENILHTGPIGGQTLRICFTQDQ